MDVSRFQAATANISGGPRDGNDEGSARLEAERDLVARAKEGDREAFGALYRGYVGPIGGLVRFRLGAPDEDVVSEVFLRAWRSIGTYREMGRPFGAWLYAIARNVAVDEVRRRGRSEPVADVPDRGVEPMTAELMTLRDAVGSLPDEQRKVIELKYLVGLTNDEVGAALKISAGAVNAKQWRALKTLAEQLEDGS